MYEVKYKKSIFNSLNAGYFLYKKYYLFSLKIHNKKYPTYIKADKILKKYQKKIQNQKNNFVM